MESSQSQRYWAFISYSHKDTRDAKWLHRAIEAWRLPSSARPLVRARLGNVKRLFPVFRDRDELPNSSDLGANLTQALEASRTLIVICSPESACSHWVNEEVLHFKRLGRSHRIFPVIIRGEPNATYNGEAEKECFCPALRHPLNADGSLDETRRVEPVAADIRPEPYGDGKRNTLLKTVAGILEVSFDSLKQRDRIRRRRQQAIAACLAGLTMLIAGTAVYQTYQQYQSKRLRVANEYLSLAEAKFNRNEYNAGVPYLKSSLAESASLEDYDVTPQLALIYRTMLAKPGKSLFDELQSDSLILLEDGRTAIPGVLTRRMPVFDLDTGNLVTALDSNPLRHYAHEMGYDEPYRLLDFTAAINQTERLLYLGMGERLFAFELDKGALVETRFLFEERGLGTIPEGDRSIRGIEILGKQLVIEFENERRWVAFDEGANNWQVVSDRHVLSIDSDNNSVFLEGDADIERYQESEVVARYARAKTGHPPFSSAYRDGSLSLIEASEPRPELVVLSADDLKVAWRCTLPIANVRITDPLGRDTILVKSKDSNDLVLFRRTEYGCNLIETFSGGDGYYAYTPSEKLLEIIRPNSSELFRLSESGSRSEGRAPYRETVLTDKGGWYAADRGHLIKIQAKGSFFRESLSAAHVATTTKTIHFNTRAGMRPLRLSGSFDRQSFLAKPPSGGAYTLFNHNGEPEKQYLPDIDRQTIASISSKLPADRPPIFGGAALVEKTLQSHGLFWHTPIVQRPVGNFIYGHTFGTLSRVEIEANRLEALPVEHGLHLFNEASGEIWTRSSTSGALSVFSPESFSSLAIKGSEELFANTDWTSGGGLVFSPSGERSLAYNSHGLWTLINNKQVTQLSNAMADVKLALAASDGNSWIVSTLDDRLIRIDADASKIMQQAPLRVDANALTVYSSQNLILVGTPNGVALHDATSLTEIALIPGSGRYEAVGDGELLLLAVQSQENDYGWNVYELPAFNRTLLQRVDELRMSSTQSGTPRGN